MSFFFKAEHASHAFQALFVRACESSIKIEGGLNLLVLLLLLLQVQVLEVVVVQVLLVQALGLVPVEIEATMPYLALPSHLPTRA